MRYLASIILTLALIFGFNVPMVAASASVVEASSSSVVHVSEKPNKPKKPKKPKKGKGRYKRNGSVNKLSFAFASSSQQLDNGNGNGNGKKKGVKKKNKKSSKNAGKRSSRRSNPNPFTSGSSSAGERPRQAPIQCVIIEQPIETRIEYRTRTVTDRVVYGAGLVALGAIVAGLLALFFGFILGWRRAGKNEDKFINSVLHEDN